MQFSHLNNLDDPAPARGEESDALPRLLVFASLVHANTSGGGAFVGASPAAIKLAITSDPLAGFHHALASGTGAFHDRRHEVILHHDRD